MITNKQSDQELIDLVQSKSSNSTAISEIIDRHSGIYLEIINTYAARTNSFINRDDLIQDKDYNIYSSALKYDPTRGTKFSTFLGNETKWLCLNTYNKNKRRPLILTDTLDIYDHKQGPLDSLKENIDKDLFSKILYIIKELPDKRVEKIFKMRYIIGNKNKVMPWKRIGRAMDLSIQGCINIHNSAIFQSENN